MMSKGKFLFALLGIPLAIYVGFFLYVYSIQQSVYFAYADEPFVQFLADEHEVTFERDGFQLQAWFVDRPITRENPLIVAFGGQGQDNSSMALSLVKGTDNAIFTMNHRGYGTSEGSSTEATLFGDAHSVFREFIDDKGIDVKDVVLFGYSQGTAVVTYIGQQEPDVKGIVYTAPLDRGPNILKAHFPIYPGWAIDKVALYEFNSLERVKDFKHTALFIIGSDDFTMPHKVSLNLFDNYAGPKRKLTLDAHHNNYYQNPYYYHLVERYIGNLNSGDPLSFAVDDFELIDDLDEGSSSFFRNYGRLISFVD